ncbi:MAG: helix-turn-helix domain-containing protein [Pseudonocardia sp.]
MTALLGQLAGLLTEDARPENDSPNERAAPPARVLLTVEEAAERLGMGKTKTYSFIQSGELESVRIGRLRRIHVDSIATFAARLLTQNSAA